MEKRLIVLFLGLAVALMPSCRKEDIITYDPDNSAVNFQATSFQFSLKGLVDPTKTVSVPFNLVGPAVDYDREVTVKVVDGDNTTAKPGVDYTLPDKVYVKAGELSGSIDLVLNAFKEGTTNLSLCLAIEPNQWFREGFQTYSKTIVSWSEEYVRPKTPVFRYWYYFFCNGYSQNLHKLIVQEFGDGIETYTASVGAVKADSTLTYKGVNYWYACSRQFRQMVKEHDEAHPDAPYMHSDDYEAYSSYSTPRGEGTKVKPVPTILETLLAM